MPDRSEYRFWRLENRRTECAAGCSAVRGAFILLVVVCMSRCAGTLSVPSVSLSAIRLAFGNQARGSASSPQILIVTNTGNATLSFSEIRLTGSYPNCFRESNSCGTSLAAGASCRVSIQFVPSGKGTFAAAVILNDNATDSPQAVSVLGLGTSSSSGGSSGGGSGSGGGNGSGSGGGNGSGNGGGNGSGNGDPGQNGGSGGVSLSPGSVSFGNQPVDVVSSPETISLSNDSGAALSLTSIALTGADPGDFTENDDCGASLAAGGSCTIETLFTPSASGSRSALLSITDSVDGGPQTVTLSGTGTHDVILSWSGSAGAAGYDVYRGTSPGGEAPTPLNSGLIAGTTYTDANVQAGVTYYYKVTASNGNTQSGPSAEASATVPSP